MKLYGSLKELVSVVFRNVSSGFQVSLKENQTTVYSADRTVQLPDQNANSTLISRDSTDTLTNKTISGASNTISNVSLTTGVTGILPTANGGTNQNSSATFPASGVVVTEAASETLTNKTISGSSNTLTVLAGSQLSGQVPTANGGTGQNSTATFPTSGVVVTEAASETLTNKTISGSSNTLTVLAGTQLSGQVPIVNGGTGQGTKAAGFDALSPMSASGDIIYGGTSGTGTRLAKGSDGQFLTLASGLPSWSSITSSQSIVTKTTTYAVLDNDGYTLILADDTSASFTITLPAAANNTNRIITLKKTVNTTNVVTVKGNASENIDGVNTKKLNTQYEAIDVQCDGTGWQILARRIPEFWQTSGYTPTFSNLGTPTNVAFQWQRVGDSIKLRGRVTAGTVGTGASGINFPTGFNLDTAKMGTANKQRLGFIQRLVNGQSFLLGTTAVAIFYDGNAGDAAFCLTLGSGSYTASNGNAAFSTGDELDFNLEYPVSNWEG